MATERYKVLRCTSESNPGVHVPELADQALLLP